MHGCHSIDAVNDGNANGRRIVRMPARSPVRHAGTMARTTTGVIRTHRVRTLRLPLWLRARYAASMLTHDAATHATGTGEVMSDWAAARSNKWRRQIGGLETMLAPLDAPLIDALALDAPARIADIGCGGGPTSIAVLRQAPAGSVVHGFDLSPALVEVARRRAGADSPSLAFEVADAGTTPPPDRPYDRLISRMGVMFFADPPSAFANLRRWLAPGGRFAFAVWGPLDDNPWMTVTRAAVAEAMALAPVDPAVPGPFRYAEVTALPALLAQAGFAGIDVADWRQSLPVGPGPTAASAARFALAAFSQFSEQLAQAGDDAAQRALRALTAGFAPYQRDGAVRMPARVHIVTGQAAASPNGGRP